MLELTRPIVVFDLETTGTDVATDRIVEISVLKLSPDGTRESKTRRINPERPIPAGASAVHGIYDADVRDCPTFRQVARALLDLIGDSDLAGFNVTRFDAPLLDRELRDCGLDLGLADRKIIDAMTIFHRMQPRDLSAAVRFYLDRDLDGAHSAEADVAATADVLFAQLERYEELPREVGQLDAWIRRTKPDAVEPSGKFVWREGEAVFSFGKHQGKSLRSIVDTAPDYLQWILGSDFPSDSKQVVERALRGDFPAPPAAPPSTQST